MRLQEFNCPGRSRIVSIPFQTKGSFDIAYTYMADDIRYRKINPIYNAIDAGNFKGAIKLCQRKDITKWDLTKALNAYCLIMLNKMEDGLALAREVKVGQWCSYMYTIRIIWCSCSNSCGRLLIPLMRVS